MSEYKQNIIYVYDKNNQLIAIFGEESQGINQTQTLEGLSEAAMRELMVAPTVHIESNGASTFTFQMLANATKWQTIKDPENMYFVNGRYYTPMTENAYVYSGEDAARIVTVTCVETWYLLRSKYKQAYNCGIYCQCEGTIGITEYYQNQFERPLYFQSRREYCSNTGKTISSSNAFQQVQQWEEKDKDNNPISYRLIAPENASKDTWIGAPQFVNIKRLTNKGASPFIFTLENPIRPIMKVQIPLPDKIDYKSNNMSLEYFSVVNTIYDYFQQKYGNDKLKIHSGNYYIVPPKTLKKVEVNYTVQKQIISTDIDILTEETLDKSNAFTNLSLNTYTEDVEFEYSNDKLIFKKPKYHTDRKFNQSTGQTSANNYKAERENDFTIYNYLIVEFEFPNMGAFKINSTMNYTLAYGAEVVDEHTFLILPKADNKYKLTINGNVYEDNQVKDIRGTILPRGSAGYAMWAALKGTGWQLGICDVMPKDFNPAIDYGTFNIETDMEDVLSIIYSIQSLYGGILDWDSKNKILNYRAENSNDYITYDDDFNKWKGYQFREGKNFTNQPTITYDNNIITKAYILGYGNLNIKKVNYGLSYITNNSYSKETYEGYLKQELIYDTNDESGQKQLLYWGQRELAKQCKPRMNISIEATDLRTVNGLEHEVFDINDIVQVHYRNNHDNTEHIEEKRLILWEYNVFAMWDCQVEVGDKTQNEVELFKLIYNKSLKTPDPNGSGQISTNDVYLSPDNNLPNSIGGNLNWISQTTTNNSNAIAGLIVDTTSTYSYAKLFAEFQKQTNEYIKNAYSGLEFYADSLKSYAVLTSKYNYENYVTGELAKTEAALITYADKIGAYAELLAEGVWQNALGQITEAKAAILLEVSQTYATAELVTQYKNEFTTATAGFQALSDSNKAYAQQVANFKTEVANFQSSVTSYADEVSSFNSMLSRLEDNMGNVITSAEVKTMVNNQLAAVGLVAKYYGEDEDEDKPIIESYITVSADRYGGEIHLSGDLFIDSGKTFYYPMDNGWNGRVGWTYVHTEDGDLAFLGLYAQNQLIIPGAYTEPSYYKIKKDS